MMMRRQVPDAVAVAAVSSRAPAAAPMAPGRAPGCRSPVWGATNVDRGMVDGRLRVRGGRLLDFDPARLRSGSTTAVARVRHAHDLIVKD
ncbi:hypothetical protein SJA_C1-25130 [Sphingobium indicum UT26S]|uniref:Uncharacterized protein n=1 Tax=Sphingobium indicum (strain DSM 16413 / CCM 7287 / MTCC 6362 / UT26 / NBRC 101211 / UT26S) TaxID=452662 RepID=D4Z415_SPHIU|nr:hypothetical protein SJA_C1-25130 [Sphingobium indicum UT26S]